MNEAIRAAVAVFSSQAALARALGLNPVTVGQWVSGVRKLPEDRAPAVERLCGGAVTVEKLRPDVIWTRIPDPKWPHPAGRPCIDVAAPAAEQET